ncbi:MAG: hypothetical protein PHU25_04190 [Deltaproteobacteria bacterium]|nr:hypothetical protein [Deltaproteobacteria bacterium]
MKRFWMMGVLVLGVLGLGCMDREPGPVCPVPTEVTETQVMVGGWDGVDMLVVVDNSASMTEEQAILATAFFPFINSLVNPLPGWPYPPANNVRVAIVSNDMGLQYGAPAQVPPEGDPAYDKTRCFASWGDNGKFLRGAYDGDGTVNIQPGVIACADATQCPTNWTCENIDAQTQKGRCEPPQGSDGTNQTCPALAATWAEITPDAPNPNLAFQTACLSSLGTDGCGFEQQLAAAAAGVKLNKDLFVRETSLLAVIIVSDEEDCSMQDGPGIFNSSEFKGDEVNIACGENSQYLFPATSYYSTFKALKKGVDNAVVFGAFVGVPYDETKPGADGICQGPGNTITGCLDAPGMKLVVIQEEGASGTYAQYKPACTRGPADAEVTKARPGRRYVELATANPPDGFGSMSYIYSICNADWSPAMEDIAKLIAATLVGTCYEKPLDWDPATKTAKCDVVAEFILGQDKGVTPTSCPWKATPTTQKITNETTGREETHVFCPLPKLPAALDCAQANVSQDAKGWYYCQDATEGSENACQDGQDNDDDGLVDCDDPECLDCKQACGKVNPQATGKDCLASCKFNVRVTDAAKKMVRGKNLSVQCLQQFSFTDPNCQENTVESCTDGKDNDGNGVWDCSNITDKKKGTPHMADANCCPMTGAKGKPCKIDPATFENCPGSSKNKLPDACDQAQLLVGCTL